jgi:hypothetical protein
MAQNIWIVTIGSSDVQLTSDSLWWGSWCPEIEHELCGNTFEPSKTEQISWSEAREESGRITYRLPARVLGLAYNALPEQVEKYLTFPLLESFAQQLKGEQIIPTKIVVILTNQNNFFTKEDKDKDACPYWQDTCFLKRALADCFFSSDVYGLKGIEIKWIVLSPHNKDNQKYGLDDWNRVLGLVKTKFRKFKEKQKLELNPGDKVYVSHQAGTPAISSAVQFVCLAEFEKAFQSEVNQSQQVVRFLVSNEYGSPTKPIESSEYLRGIRKQEALALLARHDYSGIKSLASHYLTSYEQILLDAAIQWNHAEFGEFSNLLKGQNISEKYPNLAKKVEDRTREENWWWIAYEAAYLAWVRLEKQDNTVEAFFHSFREFEGITSKWAVIFYPDDIEDRNGQPVAILKNRSLLPQYLLDELEKLKAEGKHPEIKLYGERLFRLFQELKPELKDNEDLKPVWKKAKDIRNQQFHRLKGLDKSSLYQAWGMNSVSSWEKRFLRCLSLISGQSPSKSLKEASLMAKVHTELERAIARL